MTIVNGGLSEFWGEGTEFTGGNAREASEKRGVDSAPPHGAGLNLRLTKPYTLTLSPEMRHLEGLSPHDIGLEESTLLPPRVPRRFHRAGVEGLGHLAGHVLLLALGGRKGLGDDRRLGFLGASCGLGFRV